LKVLIQWLWSHRLVMDCRELSLGANTEETSVIS
jgi:hypothetical protein